MPSMLVMVDGVLGTCNPLLGQLGTLEFPRSTSPKASEEKEEMERLCVVHSCSWMCMRARFLCGHA